MTEAPDASTIPEPHRRSMSGSVDVPSGVAPPAYAPPPAGPLRIRFAGQTADFYVLLIKNALLSLVTLGLYTPWARAALLKYMIGSIEVDGDRFSFSGTGHELLSGFLIAFFGTVVLLGVMLTLQMSGLNPMFLLLYPVLLFVVGYAIMSSARYRLSRTSWRGIRFSERTPPPRFALQFAAFSILLLIGAGLATPWFVAWRRREITRGAHFGTRAFDFEGRGADLFGPFILSVLLTFPTLGLIWIWYNGEARKRLWNATRFGDARFVLSYTNRAYFGMAVTNALFAIITLGLAAPYGILREARFVADHMRIEGPLDLATIRQESLQAPAAGEGIGDVLDVDLGIG